MTQIFLTEGMQHRKKNHIHVEKKTQWMEDSRYW